MGNLITHPGVVWGSQKDSLAPFGAIGEFYEASVLFTAPVAVANETGLSIAQITLPPGNWEITGLVGIVPAVGTNVIRFFGGISKIQNSFDNQMDIALTYYGTGGIVPVPAPGNATFPRMALPTDRFAFNAATTVYLTVQAGFSVSTLSMFGDIQAWRRN